MEHRWGVNVTKYGLGDTGATLAACIPTNPTIVLVNVILPGGDRTLVWRVPADTQPNTPYFSLDVARLQPNFPYGFSVEPDAPM